MAITEKGFITGGQVATSNGFFTSKQFRKKVKTRWFDKMIICLGLVLLGTSIVTLFMPGYVTVTADTGFTHNSDRYSTFTFNFILGFYNIYSGLSSKFITAKWRRKLSLPNLGVILAAFTLIFFPYLDPKSQSWDEWTEARYGVTVQDENLEDGATVVYNKGDAKEIATVKKIDSQYWLYEFDSDKELPRKESN